MMDTRIGWLSGKDVGARTSTNNQRPGLFLKQETSFGSDKGSLMHTEM
jgi:hypothetical protein